MTHLYYRLCSQTVKVEAVKEVAQAPLRGISLRGATFFTPAMPWKRPITKRRHPPKRSSPFRGIVQGRKSGALLVIMFGALVAPTLFFMVTHMTSKEAPSPKVNLRATKSEEGLAQRPPPPRPPQPPSTKRIVNPPAPPRKLLRSGEQEKIHDPFVPPTTATPKAQPASRTIEVDTRAKRAEQEKKDKQQKPIPPKLKTGEQDDRRVPQTPPAALLPNPKPTEVDNKPKRKKAELERKVEEEKPLECIKNPLRDTRVDTSAYDYGCKEIEEMLQGEKQLIGRGNIRDVYRIDYKGRDVVVKVLREDYGLRTSRSRVEKIHRWEAAALDAVRGHPNIVGLLGICGHDSVTEYYGVHLDDLVLGASTRMPISEVVPMALDTARGLQALHEASGGAIVHYDIKPQQLMIDANGRVKINDLNMCRFMDADAMGNLCSFTAGKSNVGPWRSPENIAGEILSETLDVYSLAMVYYSMLAGKPPFEGQPHASKMIMEGIPPSIDPSWNTGFVEIIQDMWARDPKSRPSAREVVSRLENLRKALDLDEQRF